MTFTVDLFWWFSVVELPALAALAFWLLRLKGDLADYKVYVAEHYASHKALSAMEERLTGHLERIENRLEGLNKP